jgi:CDP-4-dehydro-6-deoxyglucose reductase
MTAHRVTLRPSGNTFEVPEGRGVLASGLASGVSLPYGCRMGCCRTCRGRVLEGSVDHGLVLPIYLSEQDKRAGYALLCQARPLSDLVVEVAELPALEAPNEYEAMVKQIERVAPDVARVSLRLPLHDPMRFTAGQYIDLLLPDGQRRSYSIANASAATGLIDIELHIRLVAGGVFTTRLFREMKPRDRVRFEGPLGTFFLRAGDEPVVLLATGTGYAPARSIIARALAAKSPRQMTLYWGARRRHDLYALDEPTRWSREHPSFRFVPVLSFPAREDEWSGRTGYVQDAVARDLPDLSKHVVYASGAPEVVDAAREQLVSSCGLPPSRFFADAFVDSSHLKLERQGGCS